MAMLPNSGLFPFLLAVGMAVAPSQAARTIGDSVRTVAETSLPRFLSRIPPGQEEPYGFQGRAEVERATVGVPIRMYGTRPSLGDSLLEGQDSSWNRPQAQDVWRVPVVVHRKVRALLTVERIGGALRAVDLGAAGLAREIGAFDSTHAGKRRGLLRVERMRCDLLMLDRTGRGFDEAEYHPLSSARPFFEGDSGLGRSRERVFHRIHRRVHERPESTR